MNSTEFTKKKEWLFSFFIVMSLTIGSSLMFHLDKLIIKIFDKISGNPLIDAKVGGVLVALEMGIIPIFAVIAFALINKWPCRQRLEISWKVFIIGAMLGALIGSTYSLNYQSLTCGILH